LKLDEVELKKADTFFVLGPSFDLIIKALEWSMQKSEQEIRDRIEVCETKRDTGRKLLMPNWNLIIETLRWILEEQLTEPLMLHNQIIMPY
jgi:hypothetical protein